MFQNKRVTTNQFVLLIATQTELNNSLARLSLAMTSPPRDGESIMKCLNPYLYKEIHFINNSINGILYVKILSNTNQLLSTFDEMQKSLFMSIISFKHSIIVSTNSAVKNFNTTISKN